MKHTKRIFAILLSLAMILTMTIAMSAVSFAAEGDEEGDTPAATTAAIDSPLTITGLENGDVANFYKVIEWVGPAAEGNVFGWKAVSGFEDVLTTDVLTSIIGNPDAEPPIEPTGITSELAGKLAKKITSATEPVATATAADKKVAIDPKADGMGAGMYMAIITPKDVDVVYNPVFVSSDFNLENKGEIELTEDAASYTDTSAAKKSRVELKKTASVDESDTPWADKEWTTTAIGETVHFRVETTIPGYGEVYQNPVFNVKDSLTDLELVEGSVKVDSPADLSEEEVKITESASGYTIEFKSAYLKTLVAATPVVITYDAIVTTDAPLHVNTEKNEVGTEYSNNPTDESDHGFKKDTTQHYTFTLDAEGLGSDASESGKKTSEIVKVGVDSEGNPLTEVVKKSEITSTNEWKSPLAGAQFKLYTDEAATKEYIPKKADGTAGTALNIVSGEDGRMTIKGLDAGTYYLKETKAPAGYVADTKVHKIVISATMEPVTLTEYTTDGVTWISADEYAELTEEQQASYKHYTYDTEVLKTYTVTIDGQATATYHFVNEGTDVAIDWEEEPPVELPFQIKNTPGTELPSTGGIGTIIFYVLGTILVLGCGIVLISRRRVHNR